MRAKEPKVVVTFASTSDAMAMEAAAREHGIPGRVIPVPSEINAGCGLSWSAPADQRDALMEGIDSYGLSYEAITELLMY